MRIQAFWLRGHLRLWKCRLKSAAERVAAVNTAMLSIQSWQYYELCGFSPLQTQFPTCLFSRVSIQNDKLGEHFSPRASEMSSLVFAQCSCRGKCMLVIWVRVRRQNTLVLTRVFGVRVCSVSLCLFEFVKLCAGCCAPVSTDCVTPPPPMWVWFRLTRSKPLN